MSSPSRKPGRSSSSLRVAEAWLNVVDTLALSSPSTPEALMGVRGLEGDFSAAAARVAVSAPWEVLDEDVWLELHGAPEPFTDPVVAVLGARSILRGLAVYPSPAVATEVEGRAADGASRDAVLGGAEAFMIRLVPREDVGEELARAFEEELLEVGASLYPALGKLSGPTLVPLESDAEHVWLLSVLEGAAAFFGERLRDGKVTSKAPFVTTTSTGFDLTLEASFPPSDAGGLPLYPHGGDLIEGDFSLAVDEVPASFVNAGARADLTVPVVVIKAKKVVAQAAARALAWVDGISLEDCTCPEGESHVAVRAWFGKDRRGVVELLPTEGKPAAWVAARRGSGGKTPLWLLFVKGGKRRRFGPEDVVAKRRARLREAPPPARRTSTVPAPDLVIGNQRLEQVMLVVGTVGTFEEELKDQLLRLGPEPSVRAPLDQACPCGSGRTYEHCCLVRDQARPSEDLRKAQRWHAVDRVAIAHVLQDGVMSLSRLALDRVLAKIPEPLADDETTMAAIGSWLAYVIPFSGQTLAARFLGQVEWRLPMDLRDWIEAVTAAPLTLVEVEEVGPFDVVTVHDRLAGESRRVVDRALSRSAEPGWNLLGKLVSHDGLVLLAASHPRVLEPIDGAFAERDLRERLDLADGPILPARLFEKKAQAAVIAAFGDAVNAAREEGRSHFRNTDNDALIVDEDGIAEDGVVAEIQRQLATL